mgnify:CR=1 FL=1
MPIVVLILKQKGLIREFTIKEAIGTYMSIDANIEVLLVFQKPCQFLIRLLFELLYLVRQLLLHLAHYMPLGVRGPFFRHPEKSDWKKKRIISKKGIE